MALGKQYKDDGSKLYVLKPVNKDEKKNKVEPHFEVSEKNNGKWEVTRKETRVSGDLFKVELRESEYEGIKYKSVVLGFRDTSSSVKETYLVDLRFNIASRNLFNMLASLKSFDNLSLSYYQADNGYDRFSLRQGEKLVNWKYEIKDLPKPIEATFKGQVMRDYSPVDELFEKELTALAQLLGRPAAKSATPASEPVEATPAEGAPF